MIMFITSLGSSINELRLLVESQFRECYLEKSWEQVWQNLFHSMALKNNLPYLIMNLDPSKLSYSSSYNEIRDLYFN